MPQDTLFKPANVFNIGGKLISFDFPVAMGIVNLTPDSFFDGGVANTPANALQQAKTMVSEGAQILDLGAASTRPGAETVSSDEELSRLLPTLSIIKNELPDVIISIDTFHATVAEEAIKNGAHIINDISGGEMDAEMFATVARLSVPYILMHMQGTPQTMQQNPTYTNVSDEVFFYLNEKVNQLKVLGVTDIIIDPGFGFGKTPAHNFTLLKDLERFTLLGIPILAGLSRKSMLNKLFNIKPENALNATTVLNTMALERGASILRVHDVKEAVEAIEIYKYLSNQ